MNTIVHSAHMDIFQNLSVDLENEGRYLFLNAIANQLRYPNSLTNYFSCVLLYLFVEANSEAIQVRRGWKEWERSRRILISEFVFFFQEQITRVLVERLIVNRPHPWGLLITFIELIKNPVYKFWDHEFVHCAPEMTRWGRIWRQKSDWWLMVKLFFVPLQIIRIGGQVLHYSQHELSAAVGQLWDGGRNAGVQLTSNSGWERRGHLSADQRIGGQLIKMMRNGRRRTGERI